MRESSYYLWAPAYAGATAESMVGNGVVLPQLKEQLK